MLQNNFSPTFQPYQPIPNRPKPLPPVADSPQKFGNEGKKDLLRDTPLRYWGYANEILETFKDPLEAGFGKEKAKTGIKHSYTVVKAYVAADGLHQAVKGYKQAEEEGYGHAGRVFTAAEKGVEAGLFQAGASLYGPAFVIATVRDVAKMALSKLFGDEKGAAALKHEVQHEIDGKTKNFIEKLPEKLKKVSFNLTDKIKPVESLQRTFKSKPELASKIIKGIPLVAGAALIPLLVHPIDSAVHKFLDVTYRPLMKTIKHGLFGEPTPKVAAAQTSHHAAAQHAPALMSPFQQASFPQYQAMPYYSQFSQVR